MSVDGMGRGVESKPFNVNMVLTILSNLGRRQLSLILSRYKYILLVFLFILCAWAFLGESKQSIHPVPQHLEEASKDYPDFEIDTKHDQDESSSRRHKEERNVKETVHNVLQKNKDKRKLEPSSPRDRKSPLEDARGSLLNVPAGANNVPSHNIQKNATSYTNQRKKNYINGNRVHNQSPPDVEWDAVGGADIYRHQDLQGYDEFAEDFAKQMKGVGEYGMPVNLVGHEQQMGEEIMQTEAFNLVASDKISYTRAVPDTRDARCQDVQYDTVLPTTSIVIIFTNEAWSPLIRTVYSVLNRSPPEYVHEIILVDDFSDKKHLGRKLERFIIKYFPSKVKLLRLKERQGLIRARLTGARAATGDVLIFLDSHCECNVGWLEPLLHRIKENRLAFVVPIIDVIDDKTLEYYHGNGNYFQVGGFTWSGHFTWIEVSQDEAERRGNPIGPTRSPTMAGGLFAVDRGTFWDLGSYDEEMDVWGGENLEMSFRIWQCGAVLETIPCSRVGHIFRSFHPYSFPGNKDTHGINTARTVEVWMDEYKKLFYMHRPDLLSAEIGSVQNRLRFKEEKKCKNFGWYLDNIYPEKFILDSPEHVFAYGRLRNPEYDVCLDNLQNDDKDSYALGEYVCHKFMASSQFFSFSKNFELRREENCAQVNTMFPGAAEAVMMSPCLGLGGTQEWAHTQEGKIIHKTTKLCLDAGNGDSMSNLVVTRCRNVPSQIWFFDHYIDS